MRLPFLQVDGDFIAQRARTVAALLGCSHAQAIGHLSLLWAWALSQGSEDEAPSGLIQGQHAARLVRAAAGWEGSAEDFVGVLSDPGVGLLERLPDGFRVRGMERYWKAWDKQRKDRARKADVRRKSSGSPADGAGQTQTQTQTQKETSASQSAAVAPLAPEDLPDATEHAHEAPEPFALETQEAPQQPRGAKNATPRPPGPGLVLFEALEASRKVECERVGAPFVASRWAFSRQNRDLGPIARLPDGHEDKARFQAAWEAFCDDAQAAALDVPFSLDFFWKCRSRYEGRGLKAMAEEAA